MKKIILCLLAVFVIASPAAQAQEQYMELMRQDLRTMKTAVVTEGMALTVEEGEAFWPVYREYELEMDKVWDERLSLLKMYAEKFEVMDDATADEIMNKALDLRSRREDLRAKFYKKMKKEVGAVLAARYMQIDNIIQNLVDLQISGELPLVMETAPVVQEDR